MFTYFVTILNKILASRFVGLAQFSLGIFAGAIGFTMIGVWFFGALGVLSILLFHSESLFYGLAIFGGCVGLTGFIVLTKPTILETYREIYHSNE